jgi:MFS family permease
MQVSVAIYMICVLLLLTVSYFLMVPGKNQGVLYLYLIIGFAGLARAFFYPAQVAYMAQIVPRKLYPNSSTWNSTVWHIAAVTGPALGGLVYGFFGLHVAYAVALSFTILSLISLFKTSPVQMPEISGEEGMIRRLRQGIHFVYRQKILLGAMALDMFAVLFGGAVALLPAFAAEILHTGPEGLGILRAAPAFGAVIMSMILAYHPPMSRTGYKLFLGVAGFGLCIILFALSQNYYLSLFLLVLTGVFDNISVVIRGIIMQLYTPDEMRGRVASVNSIFIGSSNELGSFESGLAARIMGLVPSVIFGGGMTVAIVAFTSWFVPALRKMEMRGKL